MECYYRGSSRRVDLGIVSKERFLSKIAKSVWLRKFLNLVQGEMSVIEYATKFNELSKYGYVTIDTVIKRNEKFIGGLKPKIARATVPHLHDPVVEMEISNEEMLSVFGKEKQVETQDSQGKKRKFFKEKGAHKGRAAKKGKANVI